MIRGRNFSVGKGRICAGAGFQEANSVKYSGNDSAKKAAFSLFWFFY
ncbi:hypothetical protein [Endozoicomonas sp. ALB115]